MANSGQRATTPTAEVVLLHGCTAKQIAHVLGAEPPEQTGHQQM